MTRHKAAYWIEHLQLKQHIEGGWYTEVYRSELVLQKEQLPVSFSDPRNICTHIYFLLEKNGFSAFHRIKSDELWHFYAGDPLVVYEIDRSGEMIEHLLGNETEKNQSLFCVIRKGNWFASKVVHGGEYGLAGCTVSPGFDFNDFELAEKQSLSNAFPRYADLIADLTLK